jgi:hypothetical protein
MRTLANDTNSGGLNSLGRSKESERMPPGNRITLRTALSLAVEDKLSSNSVRDVNTAPHDKATTILYFAICQSPIA